MMPYKCKEARKAYDKAYRKVNKEKIKAYREANRKKNNNYGKAYRETNRKKILAQKKIYYEVNKEKVAYLNKVWRQNNKDKVSASTAKRKALKLKQIPIYLRDCPVEKERIHQTYKLCDMFNKVTGVQHHVDHMWPLSDGGPHWSGNLQIIMAAENLSKNNKVNPNIKATIQEMLIEEEQMRYDQH